MTKPIVVAKRPGSDWTVWYTEHESGEELSLSVFGSPTIEDALYEARTSLNAKRQGWYTITKIASADDDNESEPIDDSET